MHLVSDLSMFENVTVPGYLNSSASSSDTEKRADELFERMGISHIKKQLPSQCSGGEQQRCAIARAMINRPKLIFADEPTGALNRKNTTEVLDLLTEHSILVSDSAAISHISESGKRIKKARR